MIGDIDISLGDGLQEGRLKAEGVSASVSGRDGEGRSRKSLVERAHLSRSVLSEKTVPRARRKYRFSFGNLHTLVWDVETHL